MKLPVQVKAEPLFELARRRTAMACSPGRHFPAAGTWYEW